MGWVVYFDYRVSSGPSFLRVSIIFDIWELKTLSLWQDRTMERPGTRAWQFKCNDCGKSFQDGYGLRRHLNNQFSCLDIKRENRKNTKLDFPCRFCRYRNEQEEEVKKHTMEKHGHKLIELKCPKCTYQYYRSSDFRKHAQKCHEKSQSWHIYI